MGCQTDATGHTQFFASDTYKADIYHGISHLIRAIYAAGAFAWSQCSPDPVTGMRGAQELQASGCHHKQHLQVVSDIYNMAYNIEFDVFNMSAISHLCYIAPIYTMGYHTLFVLYITKSDI